jgi:hypothetical protein
MYRYETDKCLKHPWITRNYKNNIPLTMIESYRQQDLKKRFKQVKLINLIFFYI